MREQRQKLIQQQKENDRKKAASLAQATKAKEDSKHPLVESKSVKNIVNKYIGEHSANKVQEATKSAAQKAAEQITDFNGRKNIVQHPANKAPAKPSMFYSIARGLSHMYHSLVSLGLSQRKPVMFNDLPKIGTKVAAKI